MKSLLTDEILMKIGSFGRYQLCLLFMMGCMIFVVAVQGMIATFLSAEPPWRCVTNSSSCNITGSLLPGQDGYELRCSLPRDQWEFDTSVFTSIISEWDLVCDRSSLPSISISIVYVGYLVGMLLGGILSDKFGRRPIAFFPNLIANSLALVSSFVQVFWLFVLLRGLIGVCAGNSLPAMVVLLVEYVGIKHRAKAGTSLWYFFTLALMLLALLAYLIRDWRMLLFAAAIPGFFQIFFWWFLPESSRWLITRGKQEQSKVYFTKIAKVNRKEMPPNPIAVVEEKQRVGDMRDLFRSWKMARITLISWFCWAMVSMVYFGVSIGLGCFGGNRYLEFFLVSIVELPSHYFAIKFMDKYDSLMICWKRFGRKKATVTGFLVAAVASICAVLLQRDPAETGFLIGRIIMSMIAKFFINLAYCVIYIFSTEVFPTVIRNVGLGSSNAASQIGAISSPFIIGLVNVHVLIPYSIFAVAAFLASVLCLILPETNNKPTKETFESELTEKRDAGVDTACEELDLLGVQT